MPHGLALDSDDGLVTRAQAGDREAFDQLAGRHSTRLRRLLYRITRDCDVAYDAVQEALLRAWWNIGRFQRRSQFSTWLTRIGINEAYRLARSPMETPVDPADLVGGRLPARDGQPHHIAESHEFLRAVERALAALPCDQRVAVQLRDVEGLTTQEAAATLGIGQRAFKSRLHRGRMALRRELDR